jgi:hypothetical protein
MGRVGRVSAHGSGIRAGPEEPGGTQRSRSGYGRTMCRTAGLAGSPSGGQAGVLRGAGESAAASGDEAVTVAEPDLARLGRHSEVGTCLEQRWRWCDRQRLAPGAGRLWTRLVSYAHMAISTRFRAPSLLIRLAMWVLTVLSVM